MAWTFEATERGYANLWASATLKPGADAANAETFANKIIAAEDRYKAVQAATGVPWFFIGALHMRESGCNFAGVLHNGERIIGTGKLTELEPPGRGPFADWQSAAIDALKIKNMHRVQSWSPARMLFEAEVYNGLGYVGKGVNSAYVWAGTNHEQRGKYVADHVWDGNFDDPQLGVAAVLIRLAEKRPDIHADLYPKTEPSMDEPDLLKEIQGLRADIAGLPAALVSALKGEAPKDTPVASPVTLPSTTPILERPTAVVSLLSAALAAILQINGIPVVGEGASGAAAALPQVALGTGALALTGAGGSLVRVLTAALPVIVQAMQPPKPEAQKK